MKPPSDRVLLAGAALACLPGLLLPLSNPDLFWHLSAARRMLELGGIPAADWLSATRAGSPWTDFEWLTQLLYMATFGAAGLLGLWLLKVLLMLAAAAVLWRTLSLYGLSIGYAAAGLALWSAGALARSDIRPELFSVLAFGLLLRALEARRLGRAAPSPVWCVPLFGLWANLHAGFAYGLLLLGFYAAGEFLDSMAGPSRPRADGSWRRRLRALWRGRLPVPRPSLWMCLAAGLAGSFLQPFGLAPFKVLWEHWRQMETLSSYILEWGPIRLDNPWHWPYWAFLFLGFAAALAQLRRNRWVPLGPLAALLYFGYAAAQHTRLAAYFATVSLPLALHWAGAARLLPSPSPLRRWVLAGAVVLCGGYSFWRGHSFGLLRSVFHDRFVPVAATEYLDRESRVLGGRPLYHPWGWGGYLGYRLHPRYAVFQDGRYIFHELLAEAGAAVGSADEWQGFLDRYGIEVAVMENLPFMLATTRLYPDGTTKPFQRPYYVMFMPREGWALVHWDKKALVFVRRSAVPASWLKSAEFRFARPADDAALQEALSRREIPEQEVRAEFQRHEVLLSQLESAIIKLH